MGRATWAAVTLAAIGWGGFAYGDILIDEDFSGLRPGVLGTVVGAHTEYHYLPETEPRGRWAITTFRSEMDSQRAWRVIEHDGQNAMAQFWTNKYTHCHPMIVTGDDLWQDYTVTVRFAPERGKGQSGVVFRYHNDRCYYFAGVMGEKAILKMVKDATAFRKPYEVILDEKPCNWPPGTTIEAQITVEGPRIEATIAGVTLRADDTTYPRGKVALTSDMPTRFDSVLIETTPSEADRIAQETAARAEAEAARIASNPEMKLWKKIELGDFGVGRNVRFGDLNNDGQIDVLIGQVRHHGPKDRNSELSCLTAMTFDGKQLWQVGDPDPWKDHLTNDVAFQIHDIDGDGKTEVIYVMDMTIVIADGATGETIRSIPSPPIPPNTAADYKKFPNILGDSILFCDLAGKGHASDFLIKDRYQTVWAYDSDLTLRWEIQCNTGHYPYPYDVDGDGKDEIMIGYSLVDDDGTRFWTLDSQIKDHADGVAIVPFREGEAPRILCAASDEGIFFADLKGNVLKHHYLGHVQNPVIADFRPDLPGLEAITINFWGNQGIVHMYDADGEIYHAFEPCQHGSMCMPLNWTGKPGAYWILSANVTEGGLFDGWGNRVLRFPADGHPDMCNAALDLTGDGRDEIVVWDPYEMWVYTQDDGPKEDVVKMTRNPLYNYSNYQTTVLLPE